MDRRFPLFVAAFVCIFIAAPATMAQFPLLQYDISVVDVKTGDVTKVTLLDGSGEFNPSWSNNGKHIVHDVVTNSTHDLFVTDITSGVSLPLAGGDLGNDASWSPNGSWIAFDRIPAGENTLYVVPAGGGARTAVVGDAVSPEWSQNSKRLVFQRPSDGSVRAVNVDGSGEVLVVADAARPSWSPDGQWVAFERGGDLWKIRVRASGEPIGSAVQVTGEPGFEGHASWSNNSMTLVYHSDADGDFDVWTVPADGGVSSKLTGMTNVGEFDPVYSKNGKHHVAFASFTPLPLVCELTTPDEHDFNDVRLGVGPQGIMAYFPPSFSGHGYFPRFACDQYIFSAGILAGGIVNGVKTVAEAMYASEFIPSEIGSTGAPFRVYSSTVAADVVNWPSEFRDGGGNPIIVPNAQNLVVEYNDVNGTPIHPGVGRLGVEIRQRSLAYDDPAKRSAIIIIWQIANRSSELIEDFCFGLWNDSDIGTAPGSVTDDRTSVVNGMGIAWDGNFSEAGFVAEPAIVGHFFLETPASAPTRYSAFRQPSPLDPSTDSSQYQYLSGVISNETGLAGDVRSFLATGPVDLSPGQSVLVAAAYVLGPVPTGTTSLATHPTTFRPDPNDPVLANIVQTRADVQSFYDANLQGSIPLAPFVRRQQDGPSMAVPSDYALGQNYPNPFNPKTEITFSLPKEEFVSLKVYSSVGEEVATLVNANIGAGMHRIVFDGQALPSGVYYYRIQAGAFVQTRKLLLVK
ncbi:MAG TPA: T9SS type A sorting domain-containing protein [Bacteroidota bacterium]